MTDAAVAAGLGYALLSVDWEPESMTDVIRFALGRPVGWAPALVARLRADFRTAPTDAPRSLIALLATDRGFRAACEGARAAGVPLRIVRQPAAPTAMAPPRWPVPVINDVTELADLLRVDLDRLLWLSDPAGYQRRTADGPLQCYRSHWIARGSRVPRLLEEPTPLLKATHRRLLQRLVGLIPTHPAAHGFVPGRGVLTHVTPHVAADWVFGFDLRDFFATVPGPRAYGVFRRAGYPEPVAHLLAALVTTRSPLYVLRRMPRSGPVVARRRLAGRLRDPHLPQGAPTSPAVANAVCFALDRRLAGLAARYGLAYTRYADDLCFSGRGRAPGELARWVGGIVADEGFGLNPAKTRFAGRGDRQRVTGVVVNAHPNLGRVEHDRLRAVLHDAVRNGPAAANRGQHPDFRAHLAGRVGWAEQVNPGRGARLRAQFDAIVWE